MGLFPYERFVIEPIHLPYILRISFVYYPLRHGRYTENKLNLVLLFTEIHYYIYSIIIPHGYRQ